FVGESQGAWDEEGHAGVLRELRRRLEASLKGDREVADAGAPRPTSQGPLPRAFRAGLSREDRRFVDKHFAADYGMMLEEIGNLCDGERTPAALLAHLALDFERWLDPEDLSRALDLLAEGGYLAR
ncbi:MAG: hypothetical protein JSW65_00725, partial [Candidatus Bipolaricaulota bacterium]